ncbi:MAG TPA: hypothetical protein DCQ79_07400 [Rhizobiales bacterium]|nr:hypothetical protein [Hyphomicrobiales bacterium]
MAASRRLWPILAAACLGLAVAISSWFAVSAWEERLAKAQFNDVAGDYASALQNGLDEDLGKLVAMRAFYDSSVVVDPDEFDLFTSRILEGHDSKLPMSSGLRSNRASSSSTTSHRSSSPPAALSGSKP